MIAGWRLWLPACSQRPGAWFMSAETARRFVAGKRSLNCFDGRAVPAD
jgi:hypothetical protein